MTTGTLSSAALQGLKVWQLQYSSFLLGLASTGKRLELESLIRQRLEQPCPPNKRTRIVSVDMGIRNLAFCVLEARSPQRVHEKHQEGSTTSPTILHVTAWKKIDLLETLPRAHDAPGKIRDGESKDAAKKVSNTAFTPSVMCKTACEIARKLLEYQPDAVLIERQRFRSSGSSAILEWTVRVNMLESMLWACLQTLHETSKMDTFPTLHEVNPLRVGKFWLAGTAPSRVALRPPDNIFDTNDSKDKEASKIVQRARGKVDKKDKIAIVRSWLDDSKEGTLGREASLQFKGESASIADIFRAKTARAPRGHPAEEKFRKLDDLADCLLQGAAWVRWEENRRRMQGMLSV